MSGLTATLVLGELHPWSDDMNPHTLIEVHESSAIALCIRRFGDDSQYRKWVRVEPERLRNTVFAIMALLLPTMEEHPLASSSEVDVAALDHVELRRLAAVTVRQWDWAIDATLRDSCYLRAIDFAELEVADVTVFTPTFTRHCTPLMNGDR